jgi:hypothetical protein
MVDTAVAAFSSDRYFADLAGHPMRTIEPNRTDPKVARQECRVQRIVRPHRSTMASSIINSMPPSQFQNMLYVRCLRDCKTGGLQTADTELDTIN